MPRLPQDPADVAIPVGQFVTSAAHSIPVAGLLVWKPELVDAELTEAAWQAELDAYLTSPTV
jgi:hypothetical protein